MTDKDSEKKTGAGERRGRPRSAPLPSLPVALIGMTGCGKTTIGSRVAKLLGAPFLDLDTEISARAGMEIPDIFAERGEEGFRALESELLEELLSGEEFAILSCGGGIVLREENRVLLRERAIPVWIRRAVIDVVRNERVLSRPPINGDPAVYLRLLDERTPLYRQTARFILQNHTPDATANRLRKLIAEVGREEWEQKVQPEQAKKSGA